MDAPVFTLYQTRSISGGRNQVRLEEIRIQSEKPGKNNTSTLDAVSKSPNTTAINFQESARIYITSYYVHLGSWATHREGRSINKNYEAKSKMCGTLHPIHIDTKAHGITTVNGSGRIVKLLPFQYWHIKNTDIIGND